MGGGVVFDDVNGIFYAYFFFGGTCKYGCMLYMFPTLINLEHS